MMVSLMLCTGNLTGHDDVSAATVVAQVSTNLED
jgi:hypothetical protein